MKKENKRRFSPVVITIGLCILFNLVVWKSTAFSDAYVSYVFPVITGMYGRITSIFPFSIGEIMLVAVLTYAVFTIIFTVVNIFIYLFKGKKNNNKIMNRISDILYRVTPVLMSIAVVVMSLNCFVLYHCSKLQVLRDSENIEYSIEELAELRDYIVKKCNELSNVVPHDENGNVLYEGDMKQTAISSMQNLGIQYPRLSGYYVTPKALYFSEFMCQQNMQGYYFPFSMEANYNDVMNLMNKPFTMCHELAHTHGYIYEDEANFFGFLACINSDDVFFQYSGYLGVLNYINNDFYKAVTKEEYNSHVKISQRVRYDNEFLSQEGWEQVEAKAVLNTETVKKAADVFIDTNLKANGVSSGKASYKHVVGLIMDYYHDQNSIMANSR